jgi:hypothetical protein
MRSKATGFDDETHSPPYVEQAMTACAEALNN